MDAVMGRVRTAGGSGEARACVPPTRRRARADRGRWNAIAHRGWLGGSRSAPISLRRS